MGKHFLWDPVEDNIVKEIDDSGTPVADYTTEPYLYGDLISQHRDSQSSFYHYDGQGSTTSLTDSTGTVTDTYAYSAFGEVTGHSGSTANPFQWHGEQNYYWCEGIGDFLIRRRSYDPKDGRWLAFEPLFGVDGPNGYLYALASPITYNDPTGLFTIKSGPIPNNPTIDDIDPSWKRSYGGWYRFIWDNPSDGPLALQRVSNNGSLIVNVKPCKCAGADLPLPENLCSIHTVHWAERFIEAWSRPEQGSTVDRHSAGPTTPAQYLEQVLGKQFRRTGRRLFLGICPDQYEVVSWSFAMRVKFELVNGSDSQTAFPADSFFKSKNDFAITGLTICDQEITPPSTGFNKFLYPNAGTVKLTRGLDVVAAAFVSNDVWDEYWETGMPKPNDRYSGGYQPTTPTP